MKKLLLFITPLLFTSCINDDLNKNPYGVDDQQLARVTTGGNELLSMQKLVLPQQENSYQMCFDLFATGYAGYASQTKHFNDYPVYNPRTGWVDYVFNDTYPKIYNGYFKLKSLAKGDFNKTYFALASIYRVAITHWLTDTYGPLPYTKMQPGKKEVAYDNQEELYLAMVNDLQQAVEALKKTDPADRQYAPYDMVYEGDMSKWVKYANSLLLRIAIRMSDVAPAKAKEIAENAVKDGVIESNAENAALKNTDNPVFKVSSIWGDSRVGADITNYMNAYKDPRREKFFTAVNERGADNKFFGLRTGTTNTPEKAHYSLPNIQKDTPIMWISAAEVSFLKAEGKLKGWDMNGDAKELYEKGIRLSFEQWGANIGNYLEGEQSVNGFQDELNPILNDNSFTSQITVKWDDASTQDQKLAKIITQKWIAMYPYGSQEAWAEWRRTGYPNLMPARENNSGGIISDIKQVDGKDIGGMRRLPYSSSEYKENPAYIAEAVTYLKGPDNGATNLWWVKK
ncbi:SusD/RagB family nutrient-binding outer membrane lipoprotein [Ornithobacterium rhinotracheale]|uniref:SusD/RagB family nutrient-binding outer membrane lipoprotein n=1 Tax=Ornithobacterium rhinotracheale TaxID=28251 RepID=UPI00129C495A|nr:SusD/RagB family nutrient-binding outer membrane lipoprotein [Ornithobacterium rhinotracheale]MRI62709.1 SusD/RagB family nutrient-binding outer membrane lipoprotein [Ornithobacterium rhinotracheale]